MDALQAIATRHSTRQFLAKPIPQETLERILNAGRLAATACNDQPWEFLVLTDAERRRQLAELVTYGKFIAVAPVCIVVVCRNTWGYLEDGSAASQNILVAAGALGVQSCWVGGDKAAYCAATTRFLGVPEGYRIVSFVALGYEATKEPRATKRPLAEMIHREKW